MYVQSCSFKQLFHTSPMLLETLVFPLLRNIPNTVLYIRTHAVLHAYIRMHVQTAPPQVCTVHMYICKPIPNELNIRTYVHTDKTRANIRMHIPQD